MKWQIWIEPNKIIEEEYPNGWSSDEVFTAASARWANKVTTVNPAPTSASSDDNNLPSTVSGYSSFNLGFIPTVLLGAVVIGFLGMFGGNEQQSEPTQTNNEKMEYVQPSNNVIQYSEHHIDDTLPEFFNTELQEDVVDDLGQDWDN